MEPSPAQSAPAARIARPRHGAPLVTSRAVVRRWAIAAMDKAPRSLIETVEEVLVMVLSPGLFAKPILEGYLYLVNGLYCEIARAVRPPWKARPRMLRLVKIG